MSESELEKAIYNWYIGPWAEHLPEPIRKELSFPDKIVIHPHQIESLLQKQSSVYDFPESMQGWHTIFTGLTNQKLQKIFQKVPGIGNAWCEDFAAVFQSAMIPGKLLIQTPDETYTLLMGFGALLGQRHPTKSSFQAVRRWWIENGGKPDCISLHEAVKPYLAKV